MREFFRYVTKLTEHGMEVVSQRYYSRYLGKTSNVEDPQGQGRVRVKAQQVTGRAEEIDEWAYPQTPFGGQDKGFFFPPDVDDVIYVEFAFGDPRLPRQAGSWWCNPGAEKLPSTSHVPAEFAYVDNVPQVRGIKTKRGHGISFGDSVSNPFVKLWSGEQKEAGKVAEVNHSLTMNDTTGKEEIVIASKGERRISWIDVAGKEAIEIQSANEHKIRVDDVKDEVLIQLKDGTLIQVSQTLGKILLQTKVGQVIELTDTPAGIRIQDSTGNIFQTTAAGINVVAPANVSVTAAGTATVSAGGAASVVSGGPMALTGGGGVAVTAAGPASMFAAGTSEGTFIGAKSETFLGGLFNTVIGIYGITTTLFELVTLSAQIGSLGTKFRLIDERFLAFYLSHTHSTSVPGLPTGSPLATPPTNAIVTNSLRAN